MRVFVAGLSRSGKSSRIRTAIASDLKINYISISSLLGTDQSISWTDKALTCIENQRKAVEALNLRCSVQSDYVIDGHVLIETNEAPVIVPDWFFLEAAIKSIFYLAESPEEIYSRRLGTYREVSLEEIRCLQAIETAAARRICSKLNLDFFYLTEGSLDQLITKLVHVFYD